MEKEFKKEGKEFSSGFNFSKIWRTRCKENKAETR
jgi:hypothetical protein